MIPAETRAYFITQFDLNLPFEWAWPNFSYEEIMCPDGSGALIVPAAMDKLQALRSMLRAPLRVHSAYRSLAYNRQVGGALNSYHLSGMAFDVSSPEVDLHRIVITAQTVGFTGIGRYDTFVHVDIGPRRGWSG